MGCILWVQPLTDILPQLLAMMCAISRYNGTRLYIAASHTTMVTIAQTFNWQTMSNVKPSRERFGAYFISDMCKMTALYVQNDGVSNHQRLDCLLNRLFRRRSKKIPKLRITGPFWREFIHYQSINFPHKGPETRKSVYLMTSWYTLDLSLAAIIMVDYHRDARSF